MGGLPNSGELAISPPSTGGCISNQDMTPRGFMQANRGIWQHTAASTKQRGARNRTRH